MKLHLSLLLFGLCATFARCEDEGEEALDDVPAEHEGSEDAEGWDFQAMTPEQISAIFHKIDANGNGKVSLAEVTEFAHEMRRRLAVKELNDVMDGKDKNKDGKLSFEEFEGDDISDNPEQAMAEKEAEFKELDENSDGFVDADEMAAMFHHHTNDRTETILTTISMKDKDLDKNGMLTLEEFYQHSKEEEGDEAVEITEAEKDTFKNLDVDGSGTLTLKELRAWESGSFQTERAMKKLFEVADEDKDNVVDVEELIKAKDALMTHAEENPPDTPAEDSAIDAHMHLSQWVEHHEL